mmetsp:Transcript_49431/g.107070  ORF Transcript_49431/g.107070 Transcript_49431/m.107070 type:complete len:326 (+) Transcript_49431:209-1186(+)
MMSSTSACALTGWLPEGSLRRRSTPLAQPSLKPTHRPWLRRQDQSYASRLGSVQIPWLASLLILLIMLVPQADALHNPMRVLFTPFRSKYATPPPSAPSQGDDLRDSQSSTDVASPAEERLRNQMELARRQRELPPECMALISLEDGRYAHVNGVYIPPDSCSGGYYGCDSTLDPERVLREGLMARGNNWDLLHHALQLGGSAFRGTTELVTYPDGGGAAAWADEGGYVYEITCVPTWDVNEALEGRREKTWLAGEKHFAGNLVNGEHEGAIPARVPPEHIKRYGKVVRSRSGMLYVPRSQWVDNPRFNQKFCQYAHSECDPWGV